MNPSNFIDETGNRYGKYVVLERAPNDERYGRTVIWKCRCDCGNIRYVSGQGLRRGAHKSCGCEVHPIWMLPEGEAAFNNMLFTYQKRARKKNQEWGLSDDQFREITSSPCHYCGAEPSQRWERREWNGYYLNNGIDRIDSSFGYIPGNVVPCCTTCNIAKNQLEYNDFLSHIKRIFTHISFG